MAWSYFRARGPSNSGLIVIIACCLTFLWYRRCFESYLQENHKKSVDLHTTAGNHSENYKENSAIKDWNLQSYTNLHTKTANRSDSEKQRSLSLAIENYKMLWSASDDLKTSWLHFRSTVLQTESKSQLKNVDEAYSVNNARLFTLMEESIEERKYLLDDLARKVQNKLEKLQHPSDCDNARKALLDIKQGSAGFGSTLHVIVLGLLKAYMTNRTLILHSEGWRYASEGWEYAFLPITHCKSSAVGDIKVLEFNPYPPEWSAWRIPKELEHLLKKIHGDPWVWWVGQFVSYLMRPQPAMLKKFENSNRDIGFNEFVVGVQVRWGDKLGSEAVKHNLEEYMMFVESWFQQLERRGKPAKRVVYLACEEKQAWQDMKEKYRNYKFIGIFPTKEITSQAQRFAHENLENAIIDLYFLSRCNYVVCTLSSNFCQTIYELMMTNVDDASLRLQSVDNPYYFRVGPPPIWEAIMDHEPVGPDELAFRRGDKLQINLQFDLPFNDGFVRARNLRTLKDGKFPPFKGRQIIQRFDEAEVRRDLKSLF